MLSLYIFSLELQNKQLAFAHIIPTFLLNHFCLTSGINEEDIGLYHYDLRRKYMVLKTFEWWFPMSRLYKMMEGGAVIHIPFGNQLIQSHQSLNLILNSSISCRTRQIEISFAKCLFRKEKINSAHFKHLGLLVEMQNCMSKQLWAICCSLNPAVQLRNLPEHSSTRL